jgi:hypothetical protein
MRDFVFAFFNHVFLPNSGSESSPFPRVCAEKRGNWQNGAAFFFIFIKFVLLYNARSKPAAEESMSSIDQNREENNI